MLCLAYTKATQRCAALFVNALIPDMNPHLIAIGKFQNRIMIHIRNA